MTESTPIPASTTSLQRARLTIALAAVLWSTSGAFTKILTRDTGFGLDEPPVLPLQMAFFRAFWAGMVLLPTIRYRDLRFRPLMLVMMLLFAVMNATFVSAIALGTAANAILLQYTAPMWMYLASVWLLGEPADRRSFTALVIGLAGIAVIIVGGWHEAQLGVIAIGLLSGITYAGVVVFLRFFREYSSSWLIVLNHVGAAVVLIPFLARDPLPRPGQLIVLFFYGALQMGLPYLLMARALHHVTPQEVGTITLLEPLLNPLWAYLIAGEEPSTFTLIGGGSILGALAWRYWPRRSDNTAKQ